MHWKRDLEVLTPLFNRGAYQDTPELRVPSIRGMVRWWFRRLGGTTDEEKEAFGGMECFGQRLAREVRASRLVFRVTNVDATVATPRPLTLPHKTGNQGSPQAAFKAGARFRLEVFTRFGSLPEPLAAKVTNALEVWTLLGSLGLRANRTGGNVWPSDGSAPATAADLRSRLTQHGCKWPIRLAGTDLGADLDSLRAAATDTVKGARHVFGSALSGAREASPLKFKIVRLDNQLRLIAFAPEIRILDEAARLLKGHRARPENWSVI